MSLRRYLLLGILLPIGILIVINTVSLYRQTLGAINIAYDRTLLASAKTIGEQLDVDGFDEQSILRATVPYSALEAFEADNRSQLVYRVSNLQGEVISGFGELPFWRGRIPDQGAYAALVAFYDDSFRGEEVRVAVLLQPVASATGRGVAVVQVAETLELWETLARKVLVDTLWRQALLVAVIAFVVIVVVQRATRPVRRLSGERSSATERTTCASSIACRSACWRSCSTLASASIWLASKVARSTVSSISSKASRGSTSPRSADCTCVFSTASGVRNWCDASATKRCWWSSRGCSRPIN